MPAPFKLLAGIRPRQWQPNPDAAAVSLEHVSVQLGGLTVLNTVSLELPSGSWLALVGPNGAGKSTLLRVMAGVQPHSGRVHLWGNDARQLSGRQRSHHVAYLPQNPTMIASMSVADCVLLGRTPHFRVAGWARHSDRVAVADLLHQLQLQPLATRRMGSLSGGQAQRVMLAQALATQPSILLLDEPTSALDVGHAGLFLSVVQRLRHERGLSVVSALHDLNQAATYAQQVVLIDQGKLVANGNPQQVFTSQRLSKVYRAAIHVSHDSTGLLIRAAVDQGCC